MTAAVSPNYLSYPDDCGPLGVIVSGQQIQEVDYVAVLTYDKILIRLPKGQKDTIQAHAQAQGESVNGFIGRAINEAMERDNAAPAADENKEV